MDRASFVCLEVWKLERCGGLFGVQLAVLTHICGSLVSCKVASVRWFVFVRSTYPHWAQLRRMASETGVVRRIRSRCVGDSEDPFLMHRDLW